MPEIVLDNFAGGQADTVVDNGTQYARMLRNVWLNRQGKPFIRPGTKVHTEHGSRVIDIKPYDVISADRKVVYMANGIHHQAMGDILPTGAISTMTFPNGMAYTSGYKGMMAKDQAHIYGVSADGYPVKFFLRFEGSSHIPTLFQAGMPTPELNSIPSANPGVGSNDYSHVYYAVFHRFYLVNGTRFEDYGEPLSFTVSWNGAAIGNAGGSANVPIAIADISSMASNYLGRFGFATDDTAQGSLHCEIYRTVNGGVIPYHVMSIDAADPGGSRTDIVTDEALLSRKTLYSTAQAKTSLTPFAKYMVIADNTGWYANVKLTNPKYPVGLYGSGLISTHEYGANVLYQSVPGDIDGVPSTFFHKFNDEITGLGAVDIYPVVFERRKVWRMEGKAGLDGSGGAVPRLIADGVGCVGGFGVVDIGGALVFPGHDQFYITNGFEVKPYSPHLKETYGRWFDSSSNKWNEADYIRGFYSRKYQRAFWNIPGKATSNSAVPECKEVVVLDKELSPTVGCFQTLGGNAYDSFSFTGPVTKTWAAPDYHMFGEYASGVLVHADHGCVKYFDELLQTDNLVDASGAVGTWPHSPIVPEIITSAWSFGTERQKKWFSRIEFSMGNIPSLDSKPHGAIVETTTTLRCDSGLNLPMITPVGYYVTLSDENYETYHKITAYNQSTRYLTLENPISSTLIGKHQRLLFFPTIGYLSADIWSSNDLSRTFQRMRSFRRRETTNKLLDVFDRMVPKNTIRSTYKELKVSKGYTPLAESGALATFTGSGSPYGTAVLASGTWPASLLGSWITATGFPYHCRIVHISGNTLYFMNEDRTQSQIPYQYPVGANLSWRVYGYSTDEWFMINKITIPYEPFGESIRPFATTDGV